MLLTFYHSVHNNLTSDRYYTVSKKCLKFDWL